MSRTRRLALAAPIAASVLAAAALALATAGEEPVERAEPVAPPTRTEQPPSRDRARRPPASDRESSAPRERVRWRRSLALGTPADGRLVRGVRLPVEGEHFFTWDPVERRSPNRAWRRWGTDRLVRLLLSVAREYRRAHRGAPRMAIGDLSRPRGGDFGPQFGYIGHSTHQNGLDADVYYPRTDRRERAPKRVDQIDRGLSQWLVDRFVARGADVVLVGPSTGLTGPPGRVQALVNHDNHLHVRIR
jgi:Penicillin-insensitive murein endopeptidase